MKFTWDPQKAHINEDKHGISFEDAITREWIIGEADIGHVLVVIFTERIRGDVYRIISARRANRRERRLYEDYKRIPI